MGKREFSGKSVLMTADTLGGVWTFAIELIRSMQPHGINFYLATMGNRLSDEQHEELKSLQNVELFESSYKLEWMENPWEDVEEAGKWLLGLEEELNPDLIHLNNFCHGNLRFSAPVIVAGHSCVYSWWNAVKGENPPEEWKTYHQKVKKGLQDANFVVAPTFAMLSCLKNNYGHLGSNKVIYNGRNSSMFSAKEKKGIILSVGRIWDEAKNISLLDEACKNVDWPVYIAGNNTYPFTGNIKLYENTIHLGKLSHTEVSELMAHSSIYVLPALYEPFGLSALEAAFSGCALVLANIPSLREIWGDAAIYADPHDPEDFCRSMQMLTDDLEMLEEYAQKATVKAQAYTSDKMAHEYLNLYSSLKKEAAAKV